MGVATIEQLLYRVHPLS